MAGDCHRRYSLAPPHLRRQINQGFFTALFIDQDGSVERAELTEPFAQLLTDDRQTTPGRATSAQGGDLCRPANALVMTFASDHERTHGDLFTVGSKEASLVHLARAYSNRSDLLERLQDVLGKVERGATGSLPIS